MNPVEMVEKDYLKAEVPTLRSGDTVKVHVKVVEGTRERIQVFEGTVIALAKSGLKENFTVRRVAHGVGVERTFMIHSPRIDKIEVLRHGAVRRAKLFYLRDKVGKAGRIKEQRDQR
jgi:large subunit ribosomal protein L19